MAQYQPIVSLKLHRRAGDVIAGSVLAQQKRHTGGFYIGNHQFRHFTELPDFASIPSKKRTPDDNFVVLQLFDLLKEFIIRCIRIDNIHDQCHPGSRNILELRQKFFFAIVV